VLAWISEETAAVGPLHGISALIVFTLSGAIAHWAWRGGERPAVEPATGT
jgi:hypothetical protein